MSDTDNEIKIKQLTDRVNALEAENTSLKEEVKSLNDYVAQLEDFLRDEAEVYADSAEEDEITQIRTFSRGKETAFQYVLDNLSKMKPKKNEPSENGKKRGQETDD